MHRAVAQSKRFHRARSGLDQGPLHLRRFTGGRHVDSFFEERAFHGVGLVEDSKRLELAFRDQALDSELASWNIAFYLQIMFADIPDAMKRRDEFRFVVRPDHAPAAAEAERFEYARVRRALRQCLRIVSRDRAEEPRHKQTSGLVKLACQVLVAASARGSRRMEWSAEHLRSFRGQQGGMIAHRGHSIEMLAAENFERLRDAVEFHRDGAVSPGIVQHVAAVRRQGEVDAQAPRGIGKNANLVSRGGGKKKQMFRH